jgi:hypothetical protein
MLRKVYARTRYAIGNCWRFATRRWFQDNVTLDEATTIFGCSFGAAGWQHLRLTLQQYDENPCVKVVDTVMAAYHKQFLPDSISTIAGVAHQEPLPLFVYPWGTFKNGAAHSSKDVRSSRFCGPSTDEFIEEEFRVITKLYLKIRQNGYQPTIYPYSYLSGTWLHALDGRKRFIVMQGNHRMAVLAHLGISPIAVRTGNLALQNICESELEQWPLVASGRCDLEHAQKVFRMFFKENGWHIANQIKSHIRRARR